MVGSGGLPEIVSLCRYRSMPSLLFFWARSSHESCGYVRFRDTCVCNRLLMVE